MKGGSLGLSAGSLGFCNFDPGKLPQPLLVAGGAAGGPLGELPMSEWRQLGTQL